MEGFFSVYGTVAHIERHIPVYSNVGVCTIYINVYSENLTQRNGLLLVLYDTCSQCFKLFGTSHLAFWKVHCSNPNVSFEIFGTLWQLQKLGRLKSSSRPSLPELPQFVSLSWIPKRSTFWDSSFLLAGCPCCRQINSVTELKGLACYGRPME